jgi:predicted permease
MQTLWQDLRFALRQLRKSPGFTITAILTLAIGIGANAASFSMMDAVVLRPLAVPDMAHVVTLYEKRSDGVPRQVALADFEDWQRQSHSFEQLAVRSNADMSMTGAGDPTRVQAVYASPSFFSVLRTDAFLGRVFHASDADPGGNNNVAVLSYAFWKSHLGSDPAVLGRRLELNQQPYTVIGVMPKTMQYPATVDFFLPFAPLPAELANRNEHHYQVLGRLRGGVSVAAAQAELNLIADRLAHAYPATNQDVSVTVETLLSAVNGELTPFYFALSQGATFFVLLVVCANVANLQFARGLAHRPELAMRTALGASRSRLLRQLLTESLIVGLLGGAGGILFAVLQMHVSKVTMPEQVSRMVAGWTNISLNGRALAFSLLLAVVAGLVSGLAPSLEALRLSLSDQLRAGSRSVSGSVRTSRLRNTLAVSQIALAVALVIGTALMCKGMLGMLHLGDRYEPARMLTFNVHLPEKRYDTAARRADWYNESLDRLRSLPGVERAVATSTLPYSDDGWLDQAEIEGRAPTPGKERSALRLTVSEGYFKSFHLSLLPNSGRTFSASDTLQSQPVAVVSKDFAARNFPGESALGHRVRMGGPGVNQTPWLTIVGVVDEASYALWERSRPAAVYMDASQLPLSAMTYSVVATGDPISLAPAARRALAGLDGAIPLDRVETYAQFLHIQLTGLFYISGTLAFDAFLALMLAAIGIFGAMENMVGERTREIGVRLALGARREDVLRMILGRASRLTGIGLGVGLGLAFGLARMMASLLYQVRPDDLSIFLTITLAIAAIALLASWLPARRASRVDPMSALRSE